MLRLTGVRIDRLDRRQVLPVREPDQERLRISQSPTPVGMIRTTSATWPPDAFEIVLRNNARTSGPNKAVDDAEVPATTSRGAQLRASQING